MAKKPDFKIQPLAAAFTQLVETPKWDVKSVSDLLEGDNNTRYLRSSSTDPRVSTNPSPNPPSPSAFNNQELTAKMATSIIKLLPNSASVREFSGTDADYYSARDFIRQCEDVMTNSFVADNGDKIAFVRSRLLPGSRAFSLMQASTFTEPQERKNYPEFRSNFLETFGKAEKCSLLKALIKCRNKNGIGGVQQYRHVCNSNQRKSGSNWLAEVSKRHWVVWRGNHDLYSN